MRLRVAAALASLLLLIPAPALAQGCAMCKRNLEENGGAGLIEGFYWSIILLIGMPMLLVGTFTFMVVRAGRKARREGADAPASVADAL